MYQTYLIFGAPGCGKGTQGRILGAIPRFYYFACGDMFRSLDKQSPLGQEFLRYSSKGELVPDELTVELWHDHIAKAVAAGRFHPDRDCLILDGIPRSINQAEMMRDRIHVRRVFHLSCPDLEQLAVRLRKRALLENRIDDADDRVIRRRFATYEAETQPILAYYGKDLEVAIDATAPPVHVLAKILAAVTEDGHAAM